MHNHQLFILIKYSVLATVLLASNFAHALEDRVALLFGIGDYPESGRFADLSNPVNDVQLLSKTLQALGFEVSCVTNVDGPTMKMKLGEFQDMIKPDGTAFFYFAGHGIQFNGENYLMGKNAKLQRKYELGEESMNAKMVMDAIKDKKPKSSFLFLDCCRIAPPESWLTTDTRAFTVRGLSGMGAAPGMAISFAAAPGEPAADGGGLHSPFAVSLAKHLASGQELGSILKAVANEVFASTNEQQRPWHHSDFLHDFYFSPPAAEPAVASTTSLPFVASSLVASTNPAAVQSPGESRSVTPLPRQAEIALTPILPMVLPEKGYFSNDEVFMGSPYASFTDYARKRILKQAQEFLTNSGVPDGKMGKNTQTALIAFQVTNQLPVTGRLDNATLERFGLLGIPNEPEPVAVANQSRPRNSGSSSRKSNTSSSSSINWNQAIDNGAKLRYIIGR